MDQDVAARIGALEQADMNALVAFLWPEVEPDLEWTYAGDTDALDGADASPAAHRTS